MKITVELRLTVENIHSAIETKTKPGRTIHFGPNLSNNFPTTGARTPFNALAGNRIKPVLSVEKAKAVCKYIGRTGIVDRMIIKHRPTNSDPMANIGCLKTRKSSSGFVIFNWRIGPTLEMFCNPSWLFQNPYLLMLKLEKFHSSISLMFLYRPPI
ncbi:hypothetical protein MHI24_01765 [Paenibacillus sp. FSL K6-1096]|uniref:hypothetical protein n=1 Tax=Paenibacillus sp. FSL K6-1096 TaxID=2921460 RepID=UPI0030EEF7A1